MRATRVLAVLGASVMSLAGFAGCMSEVTYTRNGVEVTPDAELVESGYADIDPCSAISDETLKAAGFATPSAAQTLSPDPDCEWRDGMKSAPTLLLWVDGPTEADELSEAIEVSGVEVEVYFQAGASGRYVARFDDLTLTLNADLELEGEFDENSDAFGKDILARGITDAMEAYGKL
ncbi:hypothetical protein [Pseudoclavibacter sp. RFBA6]|uniref:hypothetical protein n=1 Tax=Pseudoclavibacter sp. RFBA6 TaxID=2080573 RepID=UPI0011B0E4C5|nr:hypothetical protein [Pseudoclavibacter sp. RFBA6]